MLENDSSRELEAAFHQADSQLDFELTCDILTSIHINAFPNWHKFQSTRNSRAILFACNSFFLMDLRIALSQRENSDL